MAFAPSLQLSFLTGNPLRPIGKHHVTPRILPLIPNRCSMKDSDHTEYTSANNSKCEMRLAKLALVTLAASALALGPVNDAMAAKSGGRVGGQAFKSSAPRPSGPRINNSRTNIYISPPVAPPLVGGYGYGVPLFGGGWGWFPFTFFAPGPSVAVGIGGGFEFFAAILLLSVVATVIRRFRGMRDDGDDDY